MKEKKKIVSYSINENLVDDFVVITTMNKLNMSIIIESLIRDYVIKNKASANKIMLDYWRNKIDD